MSNIAEELRGSDVANPNDVETCVSGGPLKEACQLLIRQLGAFSQHLYDRVERVAESHFDEITFSRKGFEARVLF